MADPNKYGLNRDIPDPVKRLIRQRCGFGCVICGNAIYQYEHVDPLFCDAKEHDPMAIVLLCGGCHDRVTRKLLSKDTVKSKSNQPKCKEEGFSFGAFDVGAKYPEIVLGTFIGRNTKNLLRIFGDEIFTILPPEEENGPFRINAYLSDADEKPILWIKENEWKVPTDNWDVEVVGPRITIRKKQGEISLVLRTEPPKRLVVERLEMFHKNINISCKENDNLTVKVPGMASMKATAGFVSDSEVGIDITPQGVAVGKGGGSVAFNNLELGSIVLPPFPKIPRSPWQKKIPRNQPCPCNSGKKYKRCCGKIRVLKGVALVSVFLNKNV